jgi:hypothetical protein
MKLTDEEMAKQRAQQNEQVKRSYRMRTRSGTPATPSSSGADIQKKPSPLAPKREGNEYADIIPFTEKKESK